MHTDPPPGCLPCIWMTAGLVSYRLCDRELDCDRCPFDAALRGVERQPAAAAPAGRDLRPAVAGRGAFPEGRRYGDGHTWVQPAGDAAPGRVRLGLDGFAAALLTPPRALRFRPPGRLLSAGESFCELDLPGGELTLGAPLAGEVVAANAACSTDPTLPLASPYEDGWLVELRATAGGDGLRTAAEARRRAGHDLRHLRRRVALDLLAADDGVGPTLPDGGEPILDLQSLLGARRWLELLRELVH